MFSHFFIDRPIFASVLSIFITLAGGLAYFSLPLAQFPSVTPPTISVECSYPGASAEVVAATVAAPIEQQVNGVERMMYMASQCANDGSYQLTVTFENGVNLNLAQVMVQNRISLAIPNLPDVVKQVGVTTRKRSPDILMVINIYWDKESDNNSDTETVRKLQLYLSNYTTLQIKDEVARVEGVGDLFMFGQRDYSMRIWIDPEKLAARNLTAGDVTAALREQNAPMATGSIGQPPSNSGQEIQLTLAATGRLVEVAEFEKIIVKTMPDGRMVRLKDVARVELGAKSFDFSSKVDQRPGVGLVVFQLPDANALETADLVIAKMDELKKSFPTHVDYQISYETISYTSESISEVYKTLLDAVLLVATVVLLFLQNWRSALIPLAAVPVAIVGTFAVMAALGFSLNTLTLFGLVLAIGIVVDDAIVVVEAVEHHLENGESPRGAAMHAMNQVAGPVIAVGLVLSAVFLPCAFIGGLTGQFFKQFALTIASSTIISAFNSLTLSPALAAVLLRPRGAVREEALPRWGFALIAGWFGWKWLTPVATSFAANWPAAPAWLPGAAAAAFAAVVCWFAAPVLNRVVLAGFHGFNRGFKAATRGYVTAVGRVLRVSPAALCVYACLLGLTVWGFTQVPRGFIPLQDMGYFMLGVQLPDGASDERTREVMDQVQKIAMRFMPAPDGMKRGIRHSSAVAGQSFAVGASGSNFGAMFVLLDLFEDRQTSDVSSDAIIAKMREIINREVSEGSVVIFPPPPIRGVGKAGGFRFMIEDRGDVGMHMLQKEADAIIDKGRKVKIDKSGILGMVGLVEEQKIPVVTGLFTVSRLNVPQLFMDVDRYQCQTLGVKVQSVSDTMQISFGSLYVNDFNRFGRTWQVIVQTEPRFRIDESDVGRLQVRNEQGNMVHLGTMAKIKPLPGPLVLYRYNMYPAVPINGTTTAGVSSGQSNDAMRDLAREMPTTMAYEWTEMAYLEDQAGNTAFVLFGCSVVMVFLVLAAMYESWTLPLAVILVVPMCLLSAITGVWLAGQDINIFTQIGFVVLVGLASKNAILIVEYAKVQQEEGKTPYEATLAACKLRLRPIIMTSCAFILGVFPLLMARGAGGEMRKTLGTAVFSGMLGVTLFGIFLTPVFFYVIDRFGGARKDAPSHSRTFSGSVLHALHWVLIVCTLGAPLLLARRRKP